MQQPTVLRIGGVPEHFNLPWHLAIGQNKFLEQGVEARWQDYPSGTGAMMQDLQQDTLDIAVALTEGSVASIINQQVGKILQYYVTSPLIWGIHVAAASPWQRVDELANKRYAISRMGSGSHLMAFVNAQQRGWNPNELSLVTVGTLENARKALAQGEADVFMWEKFMTKPLVDRGDFRRIGECPTPWPCFVMVASHTALDEKPEAIGKLLKVISRACQLFMADKNAPQQVAQQYSLQEQDAQAWFAQTTWATNAAVAEDTLRLVISTLHSLGNITSEPAPHLICSDHCLLQ